MGIRIDVNDNEGPKKPKGLRVEVDGPSPVPDRSKDSARVPSMASRLNGDTCTICGGPFRDKSGTPGSRALQTDGTTTYRCKNCLGKR